jgi:hypothetical protein
MRPRAERKARRPHPHMPPRLGRQVNRRTTNPRPGPSTHRRPTRHPNVQARLLHSTLPVRRRTTRVPLVRRASRRSTANPKTLTKNRVYATQRSVGVKVYPNLAGSMELSGVNQLWVADITYNPAGGGVRLPGGDLGCVFAACDRMVSERGARRFFDVGGAAHGASRARGVAGIGASFRPRRAVCQWRLHGSIGGLRCRDQHESAGDTSSRAMLPASRNPSCAVNSCLSGFTLVTNTDTITPILCRRFVAQLQRSSRTLSRSSQQHDGVRCKDAENDGNP